ncbi:MAG: histidine phosphatase family protein [Promethearchaeota archaeon]
MFNLFLVRHGETKWNLKHRMQGWYDAPLTQKGKKMAKEVGKEISAISFDKIYSSTSGRAVYTASIIYDSMLRNQQINDTREEDCEHNSSNIQIITDPLLREIKLGIWEGKYLEDIKKSYGDRFKKFWDVPNDFRLEGAESFREVQERAIKFLQKIVKIHSSQENLNILIISHTVWIKTALLFFGKRNLSEIWKMKYISPCSVSLVEINGSLDNSRIIYEGKNLFETDEEKGIAAQK